MIVVLVVSLIALAAVVSAAVWYRRRRAQLRHDKLLENPLYGIRNLQLAAAHRQAKEDNRLNTMTALSALPAARSLQQLGGAQRALPNDYSGKGGAGSTGSASDKDRLYAHVYDTPRKSNLYDVPSSREAYSVPRSSYEIPPTPVKVDLQTGEQEGNLYEEVRSLRYRDEDMDGYLVPSEKVKV